MKRLLFTFLMVIMAAYVIAQESTYPLVYPPSPDARYRLYPTQNIYMFLRLDTKTGQINQVQWSTKGSEYRFTSTLSYADLTYGDTTATVGRFTLYPTTNVYNFLLIDQKDGRTWQVQWSHEPENRLVTRIW